MWCHLSTRIRIIRALRFVTFVMLFAVLITALFLSVISRAAPGANQTIGFQGRLLDSSGAVVADGYYNIQFKIYQDGSGNVAGNPDGTLLWTESYINDHSTTGAVNVKNGSFSVNLGSLNPFGNKVDWDQSTLWLSMNVAGSAIHCTTFGSGPCADDGEMLPMKRLTATPYAMNAGAVNGKTAANFVQLAQGVQTDATSNSSSIFINKTGTGNLAQLQSAGADVLTIKNTGDLAFGNSTNHSISIETAATDTDGRQLAISGGNGGSGSGTSGGDLILQGGNAGGTNGDGGNISIDAGSVTGSGSAGSIAIGSSNAGSITIGSNTIAASQTISIGTNNTAGSSTDVAIGSGGSAASGTTTIKAKNAVTIETNGTTRATFSDTTNTVYFGNGVSAATPDDSTLQGTNSSTAGVAGGSLTIQGGNASVSGSGGNIILSGGTGSDANGLVVISTPTFSTVTNDANCYTNGAVVESSCTVTASSINNSAAVIVGFSTSDQTATLPDPTNQTAGRVLYITAANTSEAFTLAVNSGATANQIPMKKNVTTTLFWNGSDWTVASGTAASSNDLPLSLNGTAAENAMNIQVGNGVADSETTLLTVDKAADAPAALDNEALLGSMYYDTTLGKLQCYEAKGWGSCGSSPDVFVTISPEYTGAVTNGTGIGSMTSDLCSDSLNINDGSSSQPEICGENETYNFYNWTSAQATAQTKDIYVTYQLPATFKEFAAGSTSLMGRTDSADSNVSYRVYRNNSETGLTACGSAVAVSTGLQTTWQKASASGTSDPSTCEFEAGDSVVFRISMTAQDDANAYVSNLGFIYSNK